MQIDFEFMYIYGPRFLLAASLNAFILSSDPTVSERTGNTRGIEKFRSRYVKRMRDVKMTELQFEAPLANFDGDEWNEFNDFQTKADIENSNNMTTGRAHSSVVDNDTEFNDLNFSESLEDLVNTFDDKITKCFCNYEDNVEQFAPVQVRTQEEIMNDCQ